MPVGNEELLWRSYSYLEVERCFNFSGGGESPSGRWWFRAESKPQVQTDPNSGTATLSGAWRFSLYSWRGEDMEVNVDAQELGPARFKFRKEGDVWPLDSLRPPWGDWGGLDSVKLGELTLKPGLAVDAEELPEPGDEVRLKAFGRGVYYFATWDMKGRKEGGAFSGDTAVRLREFVAVVGLDTLTALGLDFKLGAVALSLRRPP